MKEQQQIKNEENNSNQNIPNSILKQRQLEKEDLRRKIEYNKQRLSHQNFLYEQNYKQQYEAQRHLHEHEKNKKDPLINITKKNLQEEYTKEVTYLLRNFIIFLILSILTYLQVIIILRNYKKFDAAILSQIFSAFTFFNSFLLIVEIYRNALRDLFRYCSFRLFCVFFTFFSISLFITELWNIYIIYYKIQQRKEKCRMNARYCGDSFINKIILVFSCINIIGFISVLLFPFLLGYRSIKIILGYDFEVFYKQLIENKKKNSNEIKDKKEDKNKTQNSKNEHLKNE